MLGYQCDPEAVPVSNNSNISPINLVTVYDGVTATGVIYLGLCEVFDTVPHGHQIGKSWT